MGMIKIEDLKKTYDRHSRHANEVLHGISLELPETGFICILGPSGCGKTSLLNAIGGLDDFDSGRIVTDTEEITRSPSGKMERLRNASFGYIFQNYYLLAEHSAAYNVFIGMHSMALSRKEKLARVKDALARVDMQRYSKRPVSELSGGQQQRVAIARAIARQPKVIFADEPTGNLDEANTINICSILKELSATSLVVMVTHEERIADFFADRIIRLDDGRIVSDTTDWARGEMDAGEKDTIYTADYSEESIKTDTLSLRLLTEKDAPLADLTVVVEGNRIVIKSSDPRVVIYSEEKNPPFIKDGKRPLLMHDDFAKEPLKNGENVAKAPVRDSAKCKNGLGIRMLLNEARSLVSGSKLRKFGTNLFIIILSLLIAIAAADIVTVANIDPENFVTTDSHVLAFEFTRGKDFTDKYASFKPYIESFRNTLDSKGLDFDYIPASSNPLDYTDSMIAQLGDISISFGTQNRVNIKRLDEKTLIYGRMPERSDEIVLDRWMIDKVLSEDGILQNSIPNTQYLLGKKLTSMRKTYEVTIVGICDAGEPAAYMSEEALLAYGTGGAEVITLSEYKSITGDTRITTLKANEAIVLTDQVNFFYDGTSITTLVGNAYPLKIANTLSNTDDSIGAKLIIADEALDALYTAMIATYDDFTVWCEDKDAMKAVLSEPLPEDLDGMLDVLVIDKYADEYAAYKADTSEKFDARIIVTLTLAVACAVMLYLMQRSKIREQMDLVTVYRLLGIAKGNLVFIFAVENLILTVKYALPMVAAVYIYAQVSGLVDLLPKTVFPLWAAALTLLAISAIRLLVATVPLLRLLSKAPAKLAAKYDF